jgi:tetratricopeptide (TPR) repeat protein
VRRSLARDSHEIKDVTTLADTRTAGLTSTLRVAVVGLVLLCLWGAASWLARTAHHQRLQRGARAAATGIADLESGRVAQAVASLREAVVLEPDHADYRLALAKALVAQDRDREAEPYLLDVLRRDPVRGEANLVLARIRRDAGDETEAQSAYYRAVYGRWSTEQQVPRREARLELIDVLERAGDAGRLRAALLELSSAFPGDRTLQLQAGRRLMAAGFHADAVHVLRATVDRFADPGDSLVLLAEAEMARGNYLAAFNASRRAVARAPADAAAKALRDVTTRILSLDPALPRLSTRERTTRIRRLLTAARVKLDACLVPASAPALPADSLGIAVDRWLSQGRAADADFGFSLLDAAAQRVRSACPAPARDDAEGLVLAGLAAEGPS